MMRSLLFLIFAMLLVGFLIAACNSSSVQQMPLGEKPLATDDDPKLGPEETASVELTSQTVVTTTSQAPTPSATLNPFEPLSVSAPDCTYGGSFKSIQALDRYTVQFALCAPEVAFLAKIAFPPFGILSGEWLAQAGEGVDVQLLERPVGTGPYLVDEWVRGENLVFKAYDHYWGEVKARMPVLIFRWEPDPIQRLLELQAGMADAIDNVSTVDFTAVQSDPELVLLKRNAMNVSYLGINNSTAPFDQEKVRLALAMAVDRQAIVDTFFPPGYEVARFFTPCAIPNACVGEEWYPYDPARARELLAETGMSDGFETELAFRNVVRGYLPQPALVAEEIARQLKENLNVRVNLRAMNEDFYDVVDAGLLPGLYLLGWGADYPDVTNFLDVHFGMQSSRQFGNRFDDIADALQQGAALTGDQARQPYYQFANNALRQHVPMIPIAHGGWFLQEDIAIAYRRNVENLHANPFGFESYAQVWVPGQDDFVWLQTAEPSSLYCANEVAPATLRACTQIIETMYRFQPGAATVQPNLAESCTPNEDLTVWTCQLRQGVRFHDGSVLDANDVVMSFVVQWDAAHPLHKRISGTFNYFQTFWRGFLNVQD